MKIVNVQLQFEDEDIDAALQERSWNDLAAEIVLAVTEIVPCTMHFSVILEEPDEPEYIQPV